MTAKHTPTPYESKHTVEAVFDDETDSQTVYAIDRLVIGGGDVVGWASTPENAAFIVKACNSHEALKEACELAQEHLKAKYPSEANVFNVLREALKLTEDK